jgi:hypothetical protein
VRDSRRRLCGDDRDEALADAADDRTRGGRATRHDVKAVVRSLHERLASGA